ncbi:ABC transporter permease [Xanthocytophaga flava]|uniref:ABC transporter permease n=1 Tax=Xanthocytophaga flava TaxID=3048013 RepID=UPI0028D1287F|nr:FtsX-like permease family protein [Xanthocytophaga flavus]MDJ1470796.1 ABC transporter permease [Xanthocytophaga flavus]
MLKHYLDLSLRNIKKNTIYSAINILGFSIGIAVVLYIIQYVAYELSYDSFINEAEYIYRVDHTQYTSEKEWQGSARNYLGLGPALKEKLPDVAGFCRISKNLDATRGVPLKYQDKIFYEQNVYYVDSTFLDFFSVQLVSGNSKTALMNGNSVVISTSIAKKLFGDRDPIGLVITELDNENSNRIVTGVFEDIPENSHLKFDILIPIFGDPNYKFFVQDPWYSPAWYTYVKMGSKIKDQKDINLVATSIARTYKADFIKNQLRIVFTPVTSIYLQSDFKDELKINGSLNLVFFLILMAFLLLAISSINYSNLSIVFAMDRSKEVGLRKTFGASATQLRKQFLIDSFVTNLLSLGIAIVLYVVFSPSFNDIIGKNINTSLNYIVFTGAVIGVLIVSTLLSGAYPAILLSSFKPVDVLKGKLVMNNRSFSLRKALVVFQFCMALILIIWSLFVSGQLEFMRTANIGFNPENQLIIHNPTAYSRVDNEHRYDDYLVFKKEVLNSAAIESISTSSSVPGTEIGFTYVNSIKKQANGIYDPTPYKVMYVGYDYLSQLELQLLAGRNFSEDFPSDAKYGSIILNAEAIKVLGYSFPEDALNKYIYFQQLDEWEKVQIIGVVKNYRHVSLKSPVSPTLFYLSQDKGQQVFYSLKFAKNSPQHVISSVKDIWKKVYPDKPFNYFFLDDHYDIQYVHEKRLQLLTTFFSNIVIFICCLGLINLSLFEGKKRSKEIGIRKVLGASRRSILFLLMADFLKLVILANIIAWPIAYLIINKWLESYPERIHINGILFLVASLVSIALVMLSVFLSTYKTTNINPIKAIKSE